MNLCVPLVGTEDSKPVGHLFKREGHPLTQAANYTVKCSGGFFTFSHKCDASEPWNTGNLETICHDARS